MQPEKEIYLNLNPEAESETQTNKNVIGSIVGVTLSPMKRQIRELSHQIDTKLSQDYSFSSNTSMSH